MEATIKALKRTFQAPAKSSDDTKAQDLLAFRTIISMLSFLQSPSSRASSLSIWGSEDDRSTLSVLDALSAVLIREHEVTAVIIAANTLTYTVSINPRFTKVNGNIDSLMNKTSLPIVGDYEDKVPADLVTASLKDNESLLDAYLAAHW